MLDRTFVYVDGEWIQWNEEEMSFIDIAEDIYGRDEVTFEYEGKTYRSNMISK